MMPAVRPHRLAAVVAAIAVAAAALIAQPAVPVVRRIAIFGSSVASGTGDETGREGYAGILRELLQPRGWEVVNQSRGGDDTAKLMSRFEPDGKPEPGTRYLVPAGAGYVVIGLSLGNEGIRAATGTAAKDARFEQYHAGDPGRRRAEPCRRHDPRSSLSATPATISPTSNTATPGG